MKPLLLWFSRQWLKLVNRMGSWSMASRVRAANFLALIFWIFVPKRRRIMLTNFELCFPQWSQKQREQMAKRCYQKMCRAMLDHGVLWNASAEQIREFVKIDEATCQLLQSQNERPLIIIAPHFIGLDAAGVALNTVVRGVSLYQTQSNPVWDEAVLRGRKRFSDPVLIAKSNASDLRPVIRAMKQGLPFYYLPDMDHGRANSIFVPFFGVPAATLPMASRLARLLKAKVVMCIVEMTESGYEVHLSEPWENFPTADYEADTLRVTQELEKWIEKYPDQYMWSHRRFKTRPQGEPSVY